jgi:hypothetical protein
MAEASLPVAGFAASIDDANSGPNLTWTAAWIGAPAAVKDDRLPIFRREFPVTAPVRKATLRISGLGQFEAHLNGRKIGTALLTPGWTDYQKHVLYDTYDVTAMLRSGPNALGVMLGNGMYNVVETKGRYTKFERSFGPLKLIAQLDLTYANGKVETIGSDENWKAAAGPITFSSTYGGEDYDARLEMRGWDKPAFHDSDWLPVAKVDGPGGALVPETVPPVQAFERYEPVKITHPEKNIAIYDLGENFAGWPEIAVSGPAGAQVKLICGELLDDKGRVTQKSANAYPDSQQEWNYTLRGGGVEHWTPRFSYWGFRYVEVRSTSKAAPVRVVHLAGRFLHDASSLDGEFASSDPLLNRIHLLIDRAVLSNTVSVLTDCPHREKLGWLEQTHLAGPSLMYNYGLAGLYAKMADDMADAQLANGMVPDIAPEYPVFEGGFRDSPEWGAAVVLSPWTAYQFYGDPAPLVAHYPSMKAYANYLHTKLDGGLLKYGLGDWYDIGPGDPGESKLTSKGITATATYFELLTAMQKIAVLAGKPEDVAGFATEAETIKAAFNTAYFHADSGTYDMGSQTAEAMPLVVGLVPEEARSQVLAALIADIASHGDHVTAGDIGFHYVVRALTDGGRSDVLLAMISKKDAPSYGDQLAHGATTLTEAWDANPASSQNHFMLGHAEEWFYRGLAGIDLDMSRPGDAQIRIAPAIVGKIQWARASYASKLGRIASRWSRSKSPSANVLTPDLLTPDSLTLDVDVPASATVVLPASDAEKIRLDGQPLATSNNVSDIRQNHDATECVVKAGRHRFVMPLPATPAR